MSRYRVVADVTLRTTETVDATDATMAADAHIETVTVAERLDADLQDIEILAVDEVDGP